MVIVEWICLLLLFCCLPSSQYTHSFLATRRLDPTRAFTQRHSHDTATHSSSSSLGDIMSDDTSIQSPSSLQETYPYFTNPLDRMILTANGNVQRLVSSYYDHPVQLNILYCTRRRPKQEDTVDNTTAATSTSPIIWDRQVELSLFQHVFCRATSVITVPDGSGFSLDPSFTDDDDAPNGLAQFFRHCNILPHFTLHAAGALPNNDTDRNNDDTGNDRSNGGFWRDYTLACPQLTCRIREEFPKGLWNIRPS